MDNHTRRFPSTLTQTTPQRRRTETLHSPTRKPSRDEGCACSDRIHTQTCIKTDTYKHIRMSTYFPRSLSLSRCICTYTPAMWECAWVEEWPAGAAYRSVRCRVLLHNAYSPIIHIPRDIRNMQTSVCKRTGLPAEEQSADPDRDLLDLIQSPRYMRTLADFFPRMCGYISPYIFLQMPIRIARRGRPRKQRQTRKN